MDAIIAKKLPYYFDCPYCGASFKSRSAETFAGAFNCPYCKNPSTEEMLSNKRTVPWKGQVEKKNLVEKAYQKIQEALGRDHSDNQVWQVKGVQVSIRETLFHVNKAIQRELRKKNRELADIKVRQVNPDDTGTRVRLSSEIQKLCRESDFVRCLIDHDKIGHGKAPRIGSYLVRLLRECSYWLARYSSPRLDLFSENEIHLIPEPFRESPAVDFSLVPTFEEMKQFEAKVRGLIGLGITPTEIDFEETCWYRDCPVCGEALPVAAIPENSAEKGLLECPCCLLKIQPGDTINPRPTLQRGQFRDFQLLPNIGKKTYLLSLLEYMNQPDFERCRLLIKEFESRQQKEAETQAKPREGARILNKVWQTIQNPFNQDLEGHKRRSAFFDFIFPLFRGTLYHEGVEHHGDTYVHAGNLIEREQLAKNLSRFSPEALGKLLEEFRKLASQAKTTSMGLGDPPDRKSLPASYSSKRRWEMLSGNDSKEFFRKALSIFLSGAGKESPEPVGDFGLPQGVKNFSLGGVGLGDDLESVRGKIPAGKYQDPNGGSPLGLFTHQNDSASFRVNFYRGKTAGVMAAYHDTTLKKQVSWKEILKRLSEKFGGPHQTTEESGIVTAEWSFGRIFVQFVSEDHLHFGAPTVTLENILLPMAPTEINSGELDLGF